MKLVYCADRYEPNSDYYDSNSMMFEYFNMQKLPAENTHKENRCDSHFSMNII